MKKCKVKRSIMSSGQRHFVGEIIKVDDEVYKAFGDKYLEVLSDGDTTIKRTKSTSGDTDSGNKSRRRTK